MQSYAAASNSDLQKPSVQTASKHEAELCTQVEHYVSWVEPTAKEEKHRRTMCTASISKALFTSSECDSASHLCLFHKLCDEKAWHSQGSEENQKVKLWIGCLGRSKDKRSAAR